MFIVLLCSARAPIYCCILHGQLCERILSTILRENCRFFHFHFSHFVSCAFFSFFSVYVRCANGKTLPSELTSVTFPFVLFISFSLLLAVWAVAFNNSPINAARTATAMPKATETHRVDNMRVIINYTLATHQLGWRQICVVFVQGMQTLGDSAPVTQVSKSIEPKTILDSLFSFSFSCCDQVFHLLFCRSILFRSLTPWHPIAEVVVVLRMRISLCVTCAK